MDDRSGFRDLFIRMKNQIDYSIFNVSRKVYVGSEGYLFNRNLTDGRLDLERISEQQFFGNRTAIFVNGGHFPATRRSFWWSCLIPINQ